MAKVIKGANHQRGLCRGVQKRVLTAALLASTLLAGSAFLAGSIFASVATAVSPATSASADGPATTIRPDGAASQVIVVVVPPHSIPPTAIGVSTTTGRFDGGSQNDYSDRGSHAQRGNGADNSAGGSLPRTGVGAFTNQLVIVGVSLVVLGWFVRLVARRRVKPGVIGEHNQ